MPSSPPALVFISEASLKRVVQSLVRLILICASTVPVLGLAQDKQSAPWSIQSVLSPTLQKIQATVSPDSAG